MSSWPDHPVLYEINTVVWLRELGHKLGHPVNLVTVPQAELEWLAARFDAVWLMGVWQRSPGARDADRIRPSLLPAYGATLPDWTPGDVAGSPFAICHYEVDPGLGGEEGLRVLRERLRSLGVRLVLDFVPNHLGIDHPWTREHPEWLVQGTAEQLRREPDNYFSCGGDPPRVFAHGRDPYFPGWPDTVQVDFRQPGARRAITDLLLQVARQCDGVRCDMAMLLMRDIFLQTWGGEFDPPETELWPAATAEVRALQPGFRMIAEVYWDREYALQKQGFDYTYDKRLYDRLTSGDAPAVRAHLGADFAYQKRLVRFVENHDEERAAALLGSERSRAAALVALSLPGARLVHDGQIEGRRRKLPVQLGRRHPEPVEPSLEAFYERLLESLHDPVFHGGTWRGLEPRQAWPGNPTHEHFVAHLWTLERERRLIVANLAPTPSQCLLPLGLPELAGEACQLNDLLGDAECGREGDDLVERGLYVDLPGWGYHLFRVRLSSEMQGNDWKPVAGYGPGFQRVRELPSPQTGIYGMAWSPDGRMLALGTAGAAISLCSIDGSSTFRFRGHRAEVGSLSWSPDGRTLASASFDGSVRLWDVEKREPVHCLEGHYNNVVTVAWSPDGGTVASGSLDRLACVWNARTGERQQILQGHTDAVNCVAWSPDGTLLATASGDHTIRLWDAASWELREVLRSRDWIGSIAWSPDGRLLSVGTGRGMIDVWNVAAGQQTIVQGHTDRILSVAFSADGRLLASKSHDGSVRFWRCRDWAEIAALPEQGIFLSGLAFHPRRPVLATRDDGTNTVRLWELNPDALLGSRPDSQSVCSTTAKVVLVGNHAAGKSTLGIRLAEGVFRPVSSGGESSSWRIPIEEPASLPAQVQAEVALWEIAGQAEVRLLNPLLLSDADAALLLFDASDPADSLRGIDVWAEALQKHMRPDAPKVLVASRCDGGDVAVDQSAVRDLCGRFGLDSFIPTSSVTGRGIDDLKHWMRDSILWDTLPRVSAPRLFTRVRDFLLERKKEGSVLLSIEGIRSAVEELGAGQAEIQAVVALLQRQGLIWLLDLAPQQVLLQPERINAYAAAVIRKVCTHTDEIGSVLEERVLAGDLDYQGMQRLPREEEQIVLQAIHRSFVGHGLCLREPTEKGILLVFPSYFRRERPELEGHPAVFVTYQLTGALDEIYATLVVRLHHTPAFDKDQLWRFAADFRTQAGKRVGLKMTKGEDRAAELALYFEPGISDDVKVIFLRYVHEHLEAKASDVVRLRHYVCPHCDAPVKDREAAWDRLNSGLKDIVCARCEKRVPLWDLIEEKFASTEIRRRVRELEDQARARIDNESRELILVGYAFATAGEAGQIFRPTPNSDWGIDGEIEFKDFAGNASGQRVYLQLKSGDSYLYKRKRDATEIFTFKNERHAKFWQQQTFPVMLVIRTSDGTVRWMNVTEYLQKQKGEVKQIVFEGEPFTASNLLKLRDRLLKRSPSGAC